jgi:hypothetical protein
VFNFFIKYCDVKDYIIYEITRYFMKYTNYIRQMSERLIILLFSVTEMLFVQDAFCSFIKLMYLYR